MLVLAASCVVAGDSSADPLPPSPPTVRIAMREYAFDVDRAIPPGRVVFEVENVGTVNHMLTMVELAEDIPPLDVQLRGEERRGAPTVASVPSRPPGHKTRFALDLRPGRYGLVCFVPAPDGQIHALKGMNAEFRVA